MLRVRRVTATILHGITNNSLRVDTSITGYAGLLLGGRTILHGTTHNSLRVDTSIAGYAGLLLRICMAQLIALPGLIASGTSTQGTGKSRILYIEFNKLLLK